MKKLLIYFQKYFNYNQYFYISNVGAAIGATAEVTQGHLDIPIPPTIGTQQVTKGDAEKFFAEHAKQIDQSGKKAGYTKTMKITNY